jgi:hypothetical protein
MPSILHARGFAAVLLPMQEAQLIQGGLRAALGRAGPALRVVP